MRRILLVLALSAPVLAHAQLQIDGFGGAQSGNTEIETTEAVGGVRHITQPSGNALSTTTGQVQSGAYRCSESTELSNAKVITTCTATWHGNNDGSPNRDTGVLGTGSLGGGIDLATGASGIEIQVSTPTLASFTFHARNYDGSLCTLTSNFVTGSVTVTLPFNVSGCLDSNGQRPTDVRGISLAVSPGGFESFASAAVDRISWAALSDTEKLHDGLPDRAVLLDPKFLPPAMTPPDESWRDRSLQAARIRFLL